MMNTFILEGTIEKISEIKDLGNGRKLVLIDIESNDNLFTLRAYENLAIIIKENLKVGDSIAAQGTIKEIANVYRLIVEKVSLQ